MAYEVLKRRIGMENKREFNQDQFASEYGRSRDDFAPIREYDDGDQTTTGFTHVAYVDGNSSSYEDRGRVSEVFSPFGIKDLFSHEYVVRAIGGGRNGQQLGVSSLSGTTRPTLVKQTLTNQIDSAISNVSFSGGVFAFDEKLTNARGALSDVDKTIYGPIEFRVLNISDPTVTVKNARSRLDVPLQTEPRARRNDLRRAGSSSTIRARGCSPSTRRFSATLLPIQLSARAVREATARLWERRRPSTQSSAKN